MQRKRKRPKATAGNPWPRRLALLRQQLDISQEEAAARVSAPVGTWRGWEYGRRRPSPMIQELLRREFPEYFRKKDE